LCFRIKSCFCFFALLYSLNSFSQTDKNSEDLLLKLILPYKQATIAYVDSAVPYDTTFLFNKIKKDTLINSNNNDYLVLTPAEKVFIKSEVLKNNNYCWDDGVFENSLIIHKDSMWNYLKIQNTLIYDSLLVAYENADSTSIKKYRFKYAWVFLFSKPIFLRNESVCLLSFAAFVSPNGGHAEMGFYRKNNGKWEGWIGLSSGDW